MPHAQPRQYFAATHRAIANADSIEWEELPSLATSLTQRLTHRGANDSAFVGSATHLSPWQATMAADLDPAPASQPFYEPLPGLSAREVFEDGVFRHFFVSA